MTTIRRILAKLELEGVSVTELMVISLVVIAHIFIYGTFFLLAWYIHKLP